MNSETDSYAFSLAAILLTFAGLSMFADASTDRNRIASAQTQACCAERDPKTGQCIRRERCAVEVAYLPVAYQDSFATRPEKHADTKDPDAKMCKALPDIGRLWINVKTDKVWECVGEPHIPAFRWEERKGKADKVAEGAEPATPPVGMKVCWRDKDSGRMKCKDDKGTITYPKIPKKGDNWVDNVAIDKGCRWEQAPVNGGMVVVCPTPKKLAINEGKCLPPGCCLPGNKCPERS